MRLLVEDVVSAQEGTWLENTDFLYKRKVFHIGELLRKEVFDLWFLFPFLNLKIGLLSLVLVSQLLLHLEAAFEDDKYCLDWVIL